METLENIRIVLVEPEHPGNVGATARAMANMGLSRLILVAPVDFPSQVARARASGADPILESAQVVGTLDEAIDECTLVVASTARARTVRWPEKGPEDAMRSLLSNEGRQSALLFGRESTGLTNEELDRCHFHTRIPVDEAFSSMNLGSAVSVMLYELRRQALAMAEQGDEGTAHDDSSASDSASDAASDSANSATSGTTDASSAEALCTAADLRHFFAHLEVILDKSDPGRAGSSKRLRVMKRIFNRAPMLASEVHMFRGVLSSIESKMDEVSDK